MEAASLPLGAQCAGRMDTVKAAALCLQDHRAAEKIVPIETKRAYQLVELIDIAESNNPKTKEAWERARQEADRLNIARSAYYPKLAAIAFFGDERIVNPFPKPLAPRGYTMAELPTVQPMIGLEYVLFDSGKRSKEVERSKAEHLAAAAAFQRANQDVAFAVVQGYYGLLTEEQHLEAARQILSTAQTTEDAAQAQLQNGRATLPDVLNARAAKAQAAYDLEAAAGAERIARVTLRESLGVEPSDEIEIAKPENTPAPAEVMRSIQQLVESALQNRPDLEQLSQKLRSSEAEIGIARAAQRPSLQLDSKIGQTAVWPTSSYGQLGAADQTTWNVGVSFRWSLFDAGQRKNQVAIAESQFREQQDELREQQDRITREVWIAYVSFRTAVRQREAAENLLQSAQTSYNASFEAYQYGVKNLIDVVTAEKQLAEARLAQVQAYSAVWLDAVQLEYATGRLLRHQKPLVGSGAVRP